MRLRVLNVVMSPDHRYNRTGFEIHERISVRPDDEAAVNANLQGGGFRVDRLMSIEVVDVDGAFGMMVRAGALPNGETLRAVERRTNE